MKIQRHHVLYAGAAVSVAAAAVTAAVAVGTTHPSSCHLVDGKADSACTPGVTNPNVTDSNVKQTICVSGFTAKIRPPANYTNSLKRQQKAEYGEQSVPDSNLEEDHLIPLEIGGNPTDPHNLWPQPRTGQLNAASKDKEENALHSKVCSGVMSLQDAQNQILRDWRGP